VTVKRQICNCPVLLKKKGAGEEREGEGENGGR